MAEKIFEKITSDELSQPLCKVVVVIPAYNEDRFIGSLVLKTKSYVRDVIVVDDGSTDETTFVAALAGAIVVNHDSNSGKGVALNTGLNKAQDLNPDAVVVLDADGQHNPAEIPLVAKTVLSCKNCNESCGWYKNYFGPDKDYHALAASDIERADLVIGSRYLNHKSEVPNHRVLGHSVFNWITRFTSGVNSTDSQSGFRAFSPRALEMLSFSSNGFSVESEMQILANELGLKISEAPITVEYHEKPKRNVIKHGLLVIGGLIRLMGQYRPLLFFGLPGIVLMLGGLGMGGIVVNIFRRTSELAVGYAMISVLTSVLGLVSFSTGIILHSVRVLINETLSNNSK